MSSCYIKKQFGEKGSGIRAPGTSSIQDFQAIKAKCLRSGQLFVDASFPASESSMYFKGGQQRRDVVWMRAAELADDPAFIAGGASRFDVIQGELGDCWLLAAIANLTLNDKLFHRVVPPDQSFDTGDYAGE